MKKTLAIGVLILLCVAILAAFLFKLSSPSASPSSMTNPSLPTVKVTVGSTTVIAEVASTEAEREQGLSGRTSLPPGHGMLFVFPSAGDYGFWMKDMNFSLDMIFAGAAGTVVTVDENLSPATYYQNPPEVFYPASPVLYVLEVPAGFARQNGIRQGSPFMVQ